MGGVEAAGPGDPRQGSACRAHLAGQLRVACRLFGLLSLRALPAPAPSPEAGPAPRTTGPGAPGRPGCVRLYQPGAASSLRPTPPRRQPGGGRAGPGAWAAGVPSRSRAGGAVLVQPRLLAFGVCRPPGPAPAQSSPSDAPRQGEQAAPKETVAQTSSDCALARGGLERRGRASGASGARAPQNPSLPACAPAPWAGPLHTTHPGANPAAASRGSEGQDPRDTGLMSPEVAASPVMMRRIAVPPPPVFPI